MRALLYITYFFTLLLTGGNKIHANVHESNSAPTLNLNSPFKTHNEFLHSKRGHSSSIIVFTDFDLNEEYSSSDDYNNLDGTKVTKFKKSDLIKWYLSDNKSFISTFPYTCYYFTKPISGQSTPIYITYSVLRI